MCLSPDTETLLRFRDSPVFVYIISDESMHLCLYVIHLMLFIPPSRLLTAVSQVLEKYPTQDQAVLMACQAVPLCVSSLPSQLPPVIPQLLENAFSAFSQLDVRNSAPLVEAALNLTTSLWISYPRELPETCNMPQIASLVNTALDPRSHSNRQAAIKVGKDFVGCFMQVLSDKQLEELEREGVYRNLRALLVYYDDMTPETLQQIVVGVGMFAELKPSTRVLVEENIHSSLLSAAKKHHTHLVLQQLIWRLLSIHVQQDPLFAKQLLSLDILSTVVAIMQQEDYHLTPLLRFLTVGCYSIPNPLIQNCLSKEELMGALVDVVKANTTASLEDVANTCDFLAFLCSKCDLKSAHRIFELGLVLKLEECARKWPDACLLPACIAIEGVVNLFPPDQALLPRMLRGGELIEALKQRKAEFYCEDHHLFVKDMLSEPLVYSNSALVEVVYVTLQKLLKHSTEETLKKMCSREFVEFFTIAFIRDTITFPELVNRIAFTSHYFVFHMRTKDAIELLKEFNFHTSVANLVQAADSYEGTVAAMGLLACLVNKYYDLLKDIKPFLDTQLPGALIEKVKRYGKTPQSQFADDFSRVLLNLTADKELSLELYNKGYMDQLMELMGDNYVAVVKRSMIHAVGNIALSGQHIKQILLDRQVYEMLLKTLREEYASGDAHLLSACCRVLHILASGDWAKRKFVECGCVGTLLQLIKTRKDTPEVCWRPLGLLSSMGFMAVVNRRYVLTEDVLTAVAGVLRESTHGKVVSYTMLVFLATGELDLGCARLRELGIEAQLQKAIENMDFRKQAPDLERWGVHVLEKQNLYTVAKPPAISLPPSPQPSMSDWPPLPDTESLMEVEAQSTRKLLPLADAYLRPSFPTAIELSDTAREQLCQLGLNPSEPLFRIGRVYGSTYGHCSNCDNDGVSEELVIRVQSMTPSQYQSLIDNGWYRRGGVKMFRLRYNHNVSCCDWETRVSVHEFDHRTHKSYKKVLKRMPVARLTVETKRTHFDRESFDLYNDYHIQRHDKPRKSEYSYCEHAVNSPIAPQTVDGMEYGTFHQLYRLDGKLVAIGIIDIIPKGIVSIYMWYDVSKEVSRLSFGVYSALKEIEFVRELSQRNPNMKYYYLQGWNGKNKKLSYKANYEPEYFFCPNIVQGWVSSLKEVASAKREYVDQHHKVKTPSSDSSTQPQTEHTSEKKAKDKGVDSTDSGGADQKERSSNSVKDDLPVVSCEAYPNDLARYQQQTRREDVDVHKIVVCLNYSEYMYLGDLFQRFGLEKEQRRMMEKRYSELLVALGPEIRPQLVIDLKACASLQPEAMQMES